MSKLVAIVWHDAVTGTGNRARLEDIPDMQLSENVNYGWVIHENRQRLILGNSLCSTGEFDYIIIAKNCIIKRIKM